MVDVITPNVINFKIISFLCIKEGSPDVRSRILYCLEVVINTYVITAEKPERIKVSIVIEFVWIAEPAKTGNMAQDNIVDGLLWNLPPNSSKLYANRKNPSTIPMRNKRGESKNA